jgi:hypothetical protein
VQGSGVHVSHGVVQRTPNALVTTCAEEALHRQCGCLAHDTRLAHRAHTITHHHRHDMGAHNRQAGDFWRTTTRACGQRLQRPRACHDSRTEISCCDAPHSSGSHAVGCRLPQTHAFPARDSCACGSNAWRRAMKAMRATTWCHDCSHTQYMHVMDERACASGLRRFRHFCSGTRRLLPL